MSPLQAGGCHEQQPDLQLGSSGFGFRRVKTGCRYGVDSRRNQDVKMQFELTVQKEKETLDELNTLLITLKVHGKEFGIITLIHLKLHSSFIILYSPRLAALKEFAFVKALDDHGFPVPHVVDCNRHCVVISTIQGYMDTMLRGIMEKELSELFESVKRAANVVENSPGEEGRCLDALKRLKKFPVNYQVLVSTQVPILHQNVLKKLMHWPHCTKMVRTI